MPLFERYLTLPAEESVFVPGRGMVNSRDLLTPVINILKTALKKIFKERRVFKKKNSGW